MDVRVLAPALLVLTISLAGCAARAFTPLIDAGKDEVEQLKENVISAFKKEFNGLREVGRSGFDSFSLAGYVEFWTQCDIA